VKAYFFQIRDFVCSGIDFGGLRMEGSVVVGVTKESALFGVGKEGC